MQNRVRFFRRLEELSLEQLARRAKLNFSYINLIERGLRTPSRAAAQRTVTALGLPVRVVFPTVR